MDDLARNDRKMAHKIAEIVSDRGGKVYYVGGYVRDKILGKANKDIDVEVYGVSPDELKDIVSSLGTLKTQGASFGVYNLKGYDIDIAQPRKETATGRGHKDFEVFVDPFISEDRAAKRRDFTMNAMMQNVLTGEIVDPFDGQTDLKNGLIRHVDDVTFAEDPLRVFRAAQFAARFDFDVAPETLSLMKTMDVSALSKERVYGEMKKAMLKAEKPSKFFEVLREASLLKDWFPELERLIGCEQDSEYHPEGDVWTHTMLVLDEAAKRRDKVENPEFFMVAALCHDMGKPDTVSRDEDGRIHTYAHDKAGVPVARQFLDRLNADVRLHEYVLEMVEHHMEPHECFNNKSRVKSTNHRFDGVHYPADLCQLAVSDISGKEGEQERAKAEEAFLLERLDIYKKRAAEPMVNGSDLIAMGMKPSPEFSQILALSRKMHFSGVEKQAVLKDIVAKNKNAVNAERAQALIETYTPSPKPDEFSILKDKEAMRLLPPPKGSGFPPLSVFMKKVKENQTDKKILFIVGKTSSGKDTVANYLSEKYDIPMVVSYTTRPKRDYEINGKEHYFVNDEEMDRIEKSDGIIAYTKNDVTGIRYCATSDSIKGDIAIYIINPDGIRWFNENGAKGIDTYTIYVDCQEDTIRRRAYLRRDDTDTVEKRLNSERDEFNTFRKELKENPLNNSMYVNNTRISKEMLFLSVDASPSLRHFINGEEEKEYDNPEINEMEDGYTL